MNTKSFATMSLAVGMLLLSASPEMAAADPRLQITSVSTNPGLPEIRVILHDVPAGTLKVILGTVDVTAKCRVVNPGQNPQGLKCDLKDTWRGFGDYRLFVTAKGPDSAQTAHYDFSIAAVGSDGRNGVRGPAGPIGNPGNLYWRQLDVSLSGQQFQDFKLSCQPDSYVMAGGFSDLTKSGTYGALECAPSGAMRGWYVKLAVSSPGSAVRLFAPCRTQPIS